MLNERNGGHNRLGLLLALIALSEFTTRPLPAHDAEIHEQNSSESSTHAESVGWLVPALSLGSLLFCLHNLLADSSTLIAWSWTGFTNGRANGPVPNIHSSLTLIAQSLGLLIAMLLNESPPPGNRAIRRRLWIVYGVASCSVSYQYRNWLGYLGGLNFAFFLMSAMPLILQSAAEAGNVGNTYFTGWVLYCLLSLANVWTVAYAFVPGGVYLRERTDL
jgi:hypothetical protein